MIIWGFPGGSDSKESACNVGDQGSIPGSGRSLEKEMATHSSILAWEIPWAEEPGVLQSMGSQRNGHNSVTKQQQQQSLNANNVKRWESKGTLGTLRGCSDAKSFPSHTLTVHILFQGPMCFWLRFHLKYTSCSYASCQRKSFLSCKLEWSTSLFRMAEPRQLPGTPPPECVWELFV